MPIITVSIAILNAIVANNNTILANSVRMDNLDWISVKIVFAKKVIMKQEKKTVNNVYFRTVKFVIKMGTV